MNKIKGEDIEELKNKLKSYSEKDIIFNEPHFTQQLILREGNKKDVIENILNPERLVHSDPEEGKYGDIKHRLYFKISNTRTMILPVIFDDKKQSLYIITYIMRYRPWQKTIKKGGRR
ncbi:MAG: hypothetical protein PWQ28_841 [Candidatus Woesearchaeota archaeon]|nr:hypothetical protein [Candidatus Woesearchaeota archaeon]